MQLSEREEKRYQDGIKLGQESFKQFRDNAVLIVADLLSQKKGTRLDQIKDESKRLVFINKAKSLLSATLRGDETNGA
jgi:hypothetical protein